MRTSKRWLSEHRRLLALLGVVAALAAGAIATASSGSSAAQRPVQQPANAIPASTRAELAGAQARIVQLQALTATQSAQIRSLRAELRAAGHHDHHRNRRR